MSNGKFAFDIVAFNEIENAIESKDLSNSKSLIIVLDKTTLTKESELLLGKILDAAGHDHPNQTFLFDFSIYKQIRMIEVFEKIGLTKLIAFGVEPVNLGFNIDHRPYKSIELQKYKLLFSEPLEVLAQNPDSKKLLWSAIQGFFDL